MASPTITREEFQAQVRSQAMEIVRDTLGSDDFKTFIAQREWNDRAGQRDHGQQPFTAEQASVVQDLLKPLDGRSDHALRAPSALSHIENISNILMGQSLTRGAPQFMGHLAHRSTLAFRPARLVRMFAQHKYGRTALQEYLKAYGNDPIVEKALAASDGPGGGFMIADEMASEVIEFLRASSWFMGMNPLIETMTRGQLGTAQMSSGVTAAYVGENVNAPYSQAVFGEVRLIAKKLACLYAISNDLVRRTDGEADRETRDDMSRALRVRQDYAFTRDDGTEYAPRGLRFWCPSGNLVDANNTVNLANVTTDLGLALGKLLTSNTPMVRVGWGMAPRTFIYLTTIRDANGNFAFRDEMINRGTLWGYPYAYSTTIPVNLGGGTNESEIYVADFSDIKVGIVPMVEVMSSDTAAYANAAGTVVAAMSQDQTVVRMIMEHDMVMRHTTSVSVIHTAVWQ